MKRNRSTRVTENWSIGRSLRPSLSFSLSLSLSQRAHCSREALSCSSAAMELLSSSSWLFQGTGSPGETPGFCAMSPGSNCFLHTYLPSFKLFYLHSISFYLFLPCTVVTCYFYPDFNFLPTLYFFFLFLPL
jgi:hypothetical protein